MRIRPRLKLIFAGLLVIQAGFLLFFMFDQDVIIGIVNPYEWQIVSLSVTMLLTVAGYLLLQTAFDQRFHENLTAADNTLKPAEKSQDNLFDQLEQTFRQPVLHASMLLDNRDKEDFTAATQLIAHHIKGLREALDGYSTIANTQDSLQQALQGMTILFAEDFEPMRMVIKTILEENYGATIISVENGQQALDYLQQHQVNMVLTDASMPVLDGYELVKKLRAQGFTQKIVALTAANFGVDIARLYQAGVDEVFAKPLDYERFVTTYGNVSALHANFPRQTCFNVSTGEIRSFSQRRLLQNFSQRLDIVRQALELMNQTTPDLLESIFKAFENDDYAALQEHAFKLKSLALTFGSSLLSENCNTIMALAAKSETLQLPDAIQQSTESLLLLQNELRGWLERAA